MQREEGMVVLRGCRASCTHAPTCTAYTVAPLQAARRSGSGGLIKLCEMRPIYVDDGYLECWDVRHLALRIRQDLQELAPFTPSSSPTWVHHLDPGG